jgi:hypothetical protein
MKVRPWQWTAFTNSARGSNDTFILYHWQHKPNPDEPQQEYPFAKFNKVQQNFERKKKVFFCFKFLISMLMFQHIQIMNMNNIYKIKIGLERKLMFYLIYVEDLN